jgi:quinol monooxygenase YgiN
MSIDIIVSFEAIPGRAAELLAVLGESRDLSRHAHGCESFELYQRADDENRFMFIERWESEQAEGENMAAMFSSGQIHKILPLIVGAPDKAVITRREC